MFSRFFRPQPDLASLALRLGLAAIFIVHGYIKVVQTASLIPSIDLRILTAVGWAEVVCGVALALGLVSRLAAAILLVLQAGAIQMVTSKKAFNGPEVHKWGADYAEVGPEFNMILMIMCLAVIVLGSGVVSLDHLIAKRLRRTPAPAAPAAPTTPAA